MNLRSFQLSDCEKVTNLLKEELSDTCYKKTIRVFSKQLSYDSDLVVIAEDAQEVVGVIIGSIENNQGQYILTEHPDYERNDIGKNLVNELKERFTQRKVEIHISVNTVKFKKEQEYDAVGL
ncbi:GNAT family N-acetyltransferase [Chengkuizengella axinellae]|uniref:GNAT family N-acetyltransferase n=1 Tax=Chengkuizengella axinellae TaxID=3064388 RepID=A0ABT9J0B6_9BACL|nr:GNAT family N-acetyltransferase [Chengkuizengella sp. 2205SS18-9]MDP5275022.1 GNAT family N-acetyltransferase [Chengkuizengella sp. 2205SS18-9]